MALWFLTAYQVKTHHNVIIFRPFLLFSAPRSMKDLKAFNNYLMKYGAYCLLEVFVSREKLVL